MKEFRPEELSENNGQDGNPVFIAHKGRVFDVSSSKLWKGGTHMRRHRAGQDLTADIQAAPHGTEVLERYPRIGVLKGAEEKEREKERKIPFSGFLSRFPRLKRHPHPMTVHFPIVFMFSTTFFYIAYAVSGIKAFEITAINCLGAGILFTPVAIVTGYYTWWINYDARPIRPVVIKQRTAYLLMAVELAVFIWRILVPDVLNTLTAASAVYFILVLSLFPLVTVIGWFGAHLTFPVEGE